MPEIKHSLIHENGVFFGLPEEEYHAALALSASGIKWLRVSPLDWWARSPLNPTPFEPEPSEGMIAGTAYHKRILEGRDAFLAAYAPALNQADHPEALVTNEQLYNAIVSRGGMTKKTARKDELIHELLRVWRNAPIWQHLQKEHDDRHQGKTMIPASLMARIEVAAAMIEKHPQLSLAFTGGMPEVSIFWTDKETGIPCKARLDYLKPQAVVDLKTFTNQYGMPIRRAIARQMANYRYHIQARWYLDAARQSRTFHHPALPDHPTDQTFLFVFQQQGPAPVARGIVLGPGTIMDIARQEIDEAKAQWMRCWHTFGPDDPWVDVEDISEFDSTEFPAYIAE